MTMQRKADFALLLVTICWGVSYFLIDLCLEEMDPFTLNAWRFLVAFFVIAVLTFPRLRGVNRTTLKYAFFIGAILAVVYICCTFGVRYTSQSNAGFLCVMNVLFTPIVVFFLRHEPPEKKIILVVILCVVGIGLMTLDDQLHVGGGDLICLLCAFSYTFDLLLTEHAVTLEEVDAYQLGVFQLLFTGLIVLALALIFETPCMPQSGVCWFGVIFLAIFCTGLPYVIQPIAQKYTTATHVGVIFCLEPIFASVVAYFLAGEVLLPRAYLGAVLMLCGLLLMEIDLPPRINGKK